MNTDDPNNDGEEEFDYEALRKRRLEELRGQAPETTPEKAPVRERKDAAPSKPEPTAKPKGPVSKPPPKRPSVPAPERSAAGFPELTPLEPQIQPSTVDRSRLPTSDEQPPLRAPPLKRPSSPPRESRRRARPSSFLITLGGACIAASSARS